MFESFATGIVFVLVLCLYIFDVSLQSEKQNELWCVY